MLRKSSTKKLHSLSLTDDMACSPWVHLHDVGEGSVGEGSVGEGSVGEGSVGEGSVGEEAGGKGAGVTTLDGRCHLPK